MGQEAFRQGLGWVVADGAEEGIEGLVQGFIDKAVLWIAAMLCGRGSFRWRW